MNRAVLQIAISLLIGVSLQLARAQDVAPIDADSFGSFRIASTSLIDDKPLISIARDAEAKDFQGILVEEALNFNFGVGFAPIEGLNLNLRADAWQQQIKDIPTGNLIKDWQGGIPQLYIEDSVINEFNLDNPLIGSNLESTGFDLGASYVWETNRFGQFTLSTKATYVQEFKNNGSLLDLVDSDIRGTGERVISPELQSSLMLSWEFGNHTASAITNYFDSFKDISELDLEEINAFVDNVTTVDLQYGYSVKTGNNDRAIISFGIRNIFNEKTTQILNSTTRILDQSGGVAYGSIKCLSLIHI